MNCTRRNLLLSGAALPLATVLNKAFAQPNFPANTLKMIVPFAPGGTNDILGRILSEKMTPALGHAVVVENKSGAGGAIGALTAARSAPDGYTVLLHSSSLIIQQILNKESGYDYKKDFEPISLMTRFPLVLVIHPSLPVKNIQEFMAYAKENDNGAKLFFGSAGPASSQHLVGELFNKVAGLKIQHVPYRGNGPATAALLAGDIQVFFDIVPTALTLGSAGKVRNLAVTSKGRSPNLPDLPSLHETVLPEFEAIFW